MTPEETARQAAAILDELDKAVVGRRRTLELVLIGILAGGHVLLEDVPGLGKTLVARTFAKVLGCDFAPIQFTPDLMPTDITGARVRRETGKFAFRPGPIFASSLLADEINRAPAEDAERAARGDAGPPGHGRRDDRARCRRRSWWSRPQNPVESQGTYPLPEAQLDRFLVRVAHGLPQRNDETGMLRRRVDRAPGGGRAHPGHRRPGLLAMRESLERVEISDDLLDYVIAIVTATRKGHRRSRSAPARGGVALVQLARGQALLHQRDYVTPDDIKQVAVPALAHRITLRPELWVRRVRPAAWWPLLAAVPTPKPDPDRPLGAGRCRAGAVARVITIADIERSRAALEPPGAPSSPASLGPSSQVRADEIDIRWRPSRHARRLLTLAAAGLLATWRSPSAAPSWPASPRPRCCCSARAGRPAAACRTAHGPGRPHLDPDQRGRAGRGRRHRLRRSRSRRRRRRWRPGRDSRHPRGRLGRKRRH